MSAAPYVERLPDVKLAFALREVLPVIATVFANVAAPVIATVLLAVTAPVTPRVPDTVSLPVKARVVPLKVRLALSTN